MIERLKTGLLVLGLVTGSYASDFLKGTEVSLKFAYSIWKGKARSVFVDTSPFTAVYGSDGFTYETDKFEKVWEGGITVQSDVVGWYAELVANEFTINKDAIPLPIGNLPVKYKYNFDRASSGLGFKWNGNNWMLRLNGGIRIVAVGITKQVGNGYIGYVVDDREQFRMPEIKTMFCYSISDHLLAKLDFNTGLSKKYKSYTALFHIGYKISRISRNFTIGLGMQYERVKLETEKNTVDLELYLPFIAASFKFN